MKLTKKLLGITAIIAVIGFLALPLTGCDNGTTDSGTTGGGGTTSTTGNEPQKQTPRVEDFIISDNLEQMTNSIDPVTVTFKDGKTTSDVITVYYEGIGDTEYVKSTTLPTTAGTYAVTFNVAATTGWNAINDLSAGTLIIGDIGDKDGYKTPVFDDYEITGMGPFTYDGTAKTVIITPKDGKSDGAVTIYYNGQSTLPINAGTYFVAFNVATGTGWSHVTGLYAGTLTIIKARPIADNYTVLGNLEQTEGNITAVTITLKEGKSSGAVTNIYYNGSVELPTEAGSYAVTFDVAASADGNWSATALSLSAGTLIIREAPDKDPVAGDYNISGIGNFTYDGSAKTVTITPKDGKSTGTVTVKYGNSSTAPINVGTYTVTFDVAVAPGFNAANGLQAGTLTIGNATPAAADFDIANLTQTVGSVSNVSITPWSGKSTGVITIYYTGTGGTNYSRSTTPPTAIGTYAVTFNVAAVTNWNAINDLSAGTLTITNLPTPAVDHYTISGTGTVTYNGSAKTVTVTPKGGNSTGAVTVKYNGSTTAPINAGTYTVTFDVAAASGWNAETNLPAGTLTISPKAITFTIDNIADQTYSGSALTPALTVKDGTTTLTLTTHYTVAYTNNTSAGTATATVTGAGNYAGSTGTKTFTIKGKAITFTIDNIADQTYSGSALTPTLTVKDGTTILTLTTHYTVAYTNNTNAGTATATVTGAGNYAGSTGTKTFTIKGKAITFTIDNITDQTYSGSALQPALTVKDGTTTLTLTTHYTVSYTNNTNAGTATATVTGAGNYAGSTGSKTFTINKATPTVSAWPTAAGINQGAELSSSNLSGGTASVAGSFAWTTGTTVPAVGTNGYSVTFTPTNTNYNTVTGNVNITVTAAPYNYIINGSGTSFTATRSGVTVGAANQPIQTVIDAIRTNANNNATTIQFGNNSTALDIGTASASFSGAWGAITLTGKLTGSVTTNTTGVIATADAVSVTSTADITNNGYSSVNARTIYHNSTGTFAITSGTVSAVGYYAVYNASTGTVTISGGTVKSEGYSYAVNNNSTGTINISSGTVSAGTNTVNNTSTGTINISGGTISSEEDGITVSSANGNVNISGGTITATGEGGRTVYATNGTSKITVSGTANITSANELPAQGTILLSGANATTPVRLEITGGTVKNTFSGGNAIYNNSAGAVTISGGTVQATGTDGFAVRYTGTGSNVGVMLNLGGNPGPTITGRIRPAAAGQLTALSSFTPGVKTYTLDYASYAANNIVVVGGSALLSNFTLYNAGAWSLIASGSNIVVDDPSIPYIINGSGTSFTATRGGTTVGTANQPIQDVINAIRTAANSKACTIQFGNGTTVLDIGTASASFSNTWGAVTLTGKITGSNTSSSSGVIGLSISVTSTADIANTATDGNAVYFSSSFGSYTLNISGGTISATTGNAIYNNSSGGTVNISSGTVSATTGNAVYNYSSGGTVNISGGTVSATTGKAVNISYWGTDSSTVNISGGTVLATTGIAVYLNDTSSSSKVTISQAPGATTLVTSENITAAQGTIYLYSLTSKTNTSERLVITGGTVSNTAASANARAIYNNSTGTVNISGGTVSATGADGKAFYNAFPKETGTVNISGGTVSATTGIAVYQISGVTINVSGTANITSANQTSPSTTDAIAGTVYIGTVPGSPVGQPGCFEMTGGTVTNTYTANGCAIYAVGGSFATTTIRANIVGGTVTKAVAGNPAYSRALFATKTGIITVGSGATINGGVFNVP